MTLDEVIELIQEWIVTNGNEEITADVLRPILEAMVNQPNDLIGDLDNLTTTDKDNLVEAINEVRSLAITNAGIVVHSGSGTPIETPPVSVGLGDFYAQVAFPSTSVVSFWQYNGSVWVQQRPQRTRTVLKLVSLVGVTVTGKSQVQWMAEAINLNISNGAVYECEDGDVIDFFVNILEDVSTTTPTVRRVFTRLLTGATSVTSVVANDLMPDGSEDVPIDSELIIELGDIGTDNVWDAFNTDPSQPFAMDNEMFVSAIQNSENKLWQWIGGTGTFGSTGTPAVETDFLDLTEQPPITTYQLFRKYDDIAAMLADQSTQIAQQGILVLDASADPNITFPVGLDAEKKYAYYQKKAATTTGNISDYRLISAPYGNHTVPSQAIKTGNFTLAPTENNKTVAMDGGVCTINPNTQIYPDAYVVAMHNITDSTDGSIVCTAATGWTYKVNNNATVASGTFTFPAGATCTIIKYEGTNKIFINGGVE